MKPGGRDRHAFTYLAFSETADRFAVPADGYAADDTVFYVRDDRVWATCWGEFGIANGPF